MAASSSTTIYVEWSEPAEPNGVIKNYLIEYGTSSNKKPTEKEVTARTFQYTLTGLEKFTTYYIKVRGKTSKKGNASEVLNATTFEDRKYMFFIGNVQMSWLCVFWYLILEAKLIYGT